MYINQTKFRFLDLIRYQKILIRHHAINVDFFKNHNEISLKSGLKNQSHFPKIKIEISSSYLKFKLKVTNLLTNPDLISRRVLVVAVVSRRTLLSTKWYRTS